MSYSFKVRFSGGQGTVTDVSGDPPAAGHIAVSGHNDNFAANIGVALVDDSGGQVIGAYGMTRIIPPAPAAPAPPAPAAPPPDMGVPAASAPDGGM